MADGKYYGHMTMADGSHVPLSSEECETMLKEIDEHRERRAAALPDEKSCLATMFDGFDRLRELGWREACYCPKNGTVFDSISAGSTGIHDCYYQGEWPKGNYWILDGGDIWPAHPILFKLKPLPAPPET